MQARSHTIASRQAGGICRHPLSKIGLATDLIVGILSAAYSLLLPHLLTPPNTSTVTHCGCQSTGIMQNSKGDTGDAHEVSEMPSHSLISVTAKAHKQWQNQLLCLIAKKHQLQSCEAKDLAVLFNPYTCQRKRPVVLCANSSQK